MSDIAIKFENISKQYRLGLVSTRTLSHDLNRWWQTTVLRREDPYLKIGETNDRSKKGDSEYVWALRDIDFEVKQGEVLGIIGKNGAGKSTLLKILSRVTTPTTGAIKAKGRIASLLEVGTGFHPELTGRENIYMNGCIMGMTKTEINRKLDEIIDFAGVERYIDTPVKRYSSGMTVRLGFSIAAHLEPEILVVDEVLAVGDAEFQKKAIGKMQDVSQGDGRTVLFVSHNMGAVKALCNKCLLLANGRSDYMGDVDNTIKLYFDQTPKEIASGTFLSSCGRLKLITPYFVDSGGNVRNNFTVGEIFFVRFEIELLDTFSKIVIGFAVDNKMGQRIFTAHSIDDENFEFERTSGRICVECKIELTCLVPDRYYISFGIRNEANLNIIKSKDPIELIIDFSKAIDGSGGLLNYSGAWRVIKAN